MFGSEEGTTIFQSFDFNWGGDLVIGGYNTGNYPSTELRKNCIEAASTFVLFYDNTFAI